MKIAHVYIKGFRSIEELDIDVENYTALVGANGAGKSSVLYALRWFYDGGALTPEDCHAPGAVDPSKTQGTVEVAVTFTDLSPKDRQRLESYGRGDHATFRRTWSTGDAKDKVIGNALQGPGFAAVRAMKRVSDYRPAYVALKAELVGLPTLDGNFSMDQITTAFVAWESDASNKSALQEVSDQDASHMFGIGGTHIINQCSRFVLVPAATDISSEVAGIRKGSALSQLIGAVMENAATIARETWLTKHAKAIDELSSAMKTGIDTSTAVQADRVNSRLSALVPTAQVEFTPTIPEWTPNPTASVATTVTIDGFKNDVARQGHGVQRAVLIAMLQALIPDETLVRSQMEEGTSEEEVAALLSELPHILVALEEPEIYQHPARARSFARVLVELSDRAGVQVLVATHSPYFVLPRHYSSLRRFTLKSGKTLIKEASLEAAVQQMPNKEDNIRKHMDKYIPSAFSEGFFADVVVLVEGETDKIVLESLAELLGTPLDAAGAVVVNCEAKTGLRIPHVIFSELGVPVYTVFDSDGKGHLRKGKSSAEKSHREATETLLGWLPPTDAQVGSLPFVFGDTSMVGSHWAAWEDDLEAELEAWPSFVAEIKKSHIDVRAVGKHVSKYRTAVLAANADDMPPSLKNAVQAICAMGT